MSSSTVFLSLNDDCMFDIFDRVPLESLCALSQTNSRLRELTGRHFVQRNRYTRAIINLCDLTFKTSEEKPEKQRYCTFFRRHIQDVVFHKFGFIPGVNVDDVAKHIRSNCNPRLRKIIFSCCRLNDEFGEIIKRFLGNVETVDFHWNYDRDNDDTVSGNSGDFTSVLKHCHSLKHLLLSGYGVYKEIDSLLLGTYPKLEHFLCTIDASCRMNTWKSFLRRNNNIKALTWYFWSDRIDPVALTSSIKSIAHLERLYLSFCGYFDFSSICDNLRIICNQQQFNRLELKFLYDDDAGKMLTDYGDNLRSLRCLKGIHLFDVYFPKLPPLSQVTTMQLTSTLGHFSDFDVSQLPNLEVLHVREMTESSWNFVQYFIRHSYTLKKILINASNLFTGIDAAKLNVERRKLFGADPIVIYVDSCWNTKTDLKHDLVKMKEVEIEYNHDSDAAPFVSDYVPEYIQIKWK